MISDKGKIKKGIIEYIALEYPLPEGYRQTLTEIGKDCMTLRETYEQTLNEGDRKAYNMAYAVLERFELSMRTQMGVLTMRPVYRGDHA